jgi:hypothetical protein
LRWVVRRCAGLPHAASAATGSVVRVGLLRPHRTIMSLSTYLRQLVTASASGSRSRSWRRRRGGALEGGPSTRKPTCGGNLSLKRRLCDPQPHGRPPPLLILALLAFKLLGSNVVDAQCTTWTGSRTAAAVYPNPSGLNYGTSRSECQCCALQAPILDARSGIFTLA